MAFKIFKCSRKIEDARLDAAIISALDAKSVDLSGANLAHADLSGANLKNADLSAKRLGGE